MSHRNALCVGIVLTVVVSLLAGSAPAETVSLTVPNYSFENPTASLNWDDATTTSIQGWSDDSAMSGTWAGCWNPTNLNMTGTTGATTLIPNGDGFSIGVLDIPAGAPSNGYHASIWTTPGVTYQATGYKLKVAIGTVQTGYIGSDYTISLGIDSLPSLFGSVSGNGTSLSVGALSDVTMDVPVGLNPAYIGIPMRVTITAANPSSGAASWLVFDNVRLTTPEPSSILLLGIGLFSLLAYAWRKRK
jgi:hypothetical protein